MIMLPTGAYPPYHPQAWSQTSVPMPGGPMPPGQPMFDMANGPSSSGSSGMAYRFACCLHTLTQTWTVKLPDLSSPSGNQGDPGFSS